MLSETEKQQVTHHCFDHLVVALGDKNEVILPDGSHVTVNNGMYKNIHIIRSDGSGIDLSEMPDDLIAGEKTTLKPAGHDSELDTVKLQQPFPQDERDIQIIAGLVQAIAQTKK